MDTQAISSGAITYAVEVSGTWMDPLTQQEMPRTETFRVLAPGPRAAESAGRQLFLGAVGGRRFVRSGAADARAAAIV